MKKEAMLYEKIEGGRVLCFLCSHHCKIADSKYGFCGVRKNEKGILFTYVYGEVIASHVDPIEKKPLHHFLPGSSTYSIATIGCNFRCTFCQNWEISQVSKIASNRVPNTEKLGTVLSRKISLRTVPIFPCSERGYELKPEEVVREAKKHGARSISYTYTEPTVFFEYAYDTAKLAKKEGLYNTFVTNGFMTREALDTIKPYLDGANVDLKFFKEKTYKEICQGSLEPVLESIRHMKKIGIWVEVTTLVVPGLNDSGEEFRDIAEFIAGVGKDIPWHISRFHPDYKLLESVPTPTATLKVAASIGKKAGLKYVYLGNVTEESNTSCYNCGKLLIARAGYFIGENNIRDGKCPECKAAIEGVW